MTLNKVAHDVEQAFKTTGIGSKAAPKSERHSSTRPLYMQLNPKCRFLASLAVGRVALVLNAAKAKFYPKPMRRITET